MTATHLSCVSVYLETEEIYSGKCLIENTKIQSCPVSYESTALLYSSNSILLVDYKHA